MTVKGVRKCDDLNSELNTTAVLVMKLTCSVLIAEGTSPSSGLKKKLWRPKKVQWKNVST